MQGKASQTRVTRQRQVLIDHKIMSNANSIEEDDSCNNNHVMFGFKDNCGGRFTDCVLVVEILADDSQSGDLHQSADNASESSLMEECSRVEKLHINSTLLGEKSLFFHELFKNAEMESEQRSAALTIQASEENSFLELLNYTCNGTLTATTAPALLGVLKSAGKFQVASCMRLCTSLLTRMPMTTESALLCLDLTSSLLLMADDEVQHLVDAAKQFMATRFEQTNWNEVMKMPLACMEAILSSDSLEVCSEDVLFGIARGWIRHRYPKPEDQRKIFSTRLGRYIRFPYMSVGMLKHQVLGSDVLDEDFANKVVLDALFFKSKSPFQHYHDTATTRSGPISTTSHRPYVRRAYLWVPIRVLEFELPCGGQEVSVYFDLSRPISSMRTEEFMLGAHWLCLYVQAGAPSFALHLERSDDTYGPLALEYEFAVRSKCTNKFVWKSGGPVELVGSLTLYETPWLDFQAGKSLDFVDGVLYVEFKIMQSK